MAKFLWQASYTSQGVKGLLKDGGTVRRNAVEKMVQGMGGTLESFYYAFGDDDVYVVADLPDNETAAAVSLTIASTGAVNIKTRVLLTPEEIDRATHVSVDYRPPGA